MIDLLVGTVEEIGKSYVIVLVNGIGYRCEASVVTLSKLVIKEEVVLYTRMVVRENSLNLYGFYSKDERSMFDLLTTVSGVGPKVGIDLLSTINSMELKNAIILGDENLLTSAPGIGKKTAGRIILELKDKIGKLQLLENYETTVASSSEKEEIEALIGLGYNRFEAVEALKSVPQGSVSTRIRDALKILGR